MRKWKCTSVNNGNRGAFTIGKIYETDDEGYNFIVDGGHKIKNLSLIDEMKCYDGQLHFNEIKEEEKKVNKFKVGDVVVGNNESRYAYTKKGVKCVVTNVLSCNRMEVKIIGNENEVEFRVEEEYFDLEKSIPSSKTLTITTSDSTTTLTDGTHTVSVNRYHTDKHNEEIAVREVVKKYYDEINKKHLYDDKTDYGVIGTPTILTDSVGRKLFIGDVVKLFDKDGKYIGNDMVCHDEVDGDFIMGCAIDTKNNSKKEYNYIKEMSYNHISNDNKIWDSNITIK